MSGRNAAGAAPLGGPLWARKGTRTGDPPPGRVPGRVVRRPPQPTPAGPDRGQLGQDFFGPPARAAGRPSSPTINLKSAATTGHEKWGGPRRGADGAAPEARSGSLLPLEWKGEQGEGKWPAGRSSLSSRSPPVPAHNRRRGRRPTPGRGPGPRRHTAP